MSTSSSASWSPIAARTSAMRLVTPVEVSLWTTITARDVVVQRVGDPLRVGAVAPVALQPHDVQAELASAIARQSVAKWPVSEAITLSPGESVLTSAASHAPVPDAG